MAMYSNEYKGVQTIYAMIDFGPPALEINWAMVAKNYHYNIKARLKAAGYTADKEDFGGLTRYVKQTEREM